MLERTDTRGDGIEPGKGYIFKISDVPKKDNFSSGKQYYEFKMETTINGDLVDHQERIPTWMVGPILRALECKEVEPDVFEWEKEAVVGKEFKGDIGLEANPKDGKKYRRLQNPRKVDSEDVPF